MPPDPRELIHRPTEDEPRCADCDVRLTVEERDAGRYCFDCTPDAPLYPYGDLWQQEGIER